MANSKRRLDKYNYSSEYLVDRGPENPKPEGRIPDILIPEPDLTTKSRTRTKPNPTLTFTLKNLKHEGRIPDILIPNPSRPSKAKPNLRLLGMLKLT